MLAICTCRACTARLLSLHPWPLPAFGCSDGAQDVFDILKVSWPACLECTRQADAGLRCGSLPLAC